MKRILVIEDEEQVRSVIVAFLRTGEYEVLEAPDGLAGIELAKNHRPDLVLCDVNMPKLDGYGVITALHNDPSTAAIPFIFLTGKTDHQALRQGMNLGADDYLTKPFRRTELLGAIDARFAKLAAVTQYYNEELKQAERKMDYVMHHDTLTNLPNRLMLREKLNELVERASTGQQVAILSVGLDRFKRINETLGHASGDFLLTKVAERLTECVGNNEVVARLTADQFVILLGNINDKQAAAQMAEKILGKFSASFAVEGHEIFAAASIGASVWPADGSNIDHLIKNAETAMHHAKKNGGNSYEFFVAEIHSFSASQLAIEAGLRYALERNQLEVYYQPQVDVKRGMIVGAEALLRWNHPERGRISPASFIPVAEETGLIIPIGEWALRKAFAQAKVWQEAGFPSLRMAVNLSVSQFNQQNLTEKLEEILQEVNISPSCLDIELTESIVMRNIDEAIKIINCIKALGLQISIDDFGTGYSSLNYLKRFPFDILKIDQSFIHNVTLDSKNAAITMAIIQIARNLDLKVIAEGVETPGELFFLALHDCHEFQGYLFSPPVRAADFEQLLVSGKRLQIENTN